MSHSSYVAGTSHFISYVALTDTKSHGPAPPWAHFCRAAQHAGEPCGLRRLHACRQALASTNGRQRVSRVRGATAPDSRSVEPCGGSFWNGDARLDEQSSFPALWLACPLEDGEGEREGAEQPSEAGDPPWRTEIAVDPPGRVCSPAPRTRLRRAA